MLQQHQARINTFLAQTVPAYAATEAFNYLHTDYPDYTYKEATLNPTNLRDRAVDWEADLIQIFRNHPDQKEFSASVIHLLDVSCSWPSRLLPSVPALSVTARGGKHQPP